MHNETDFLIQHGYIVIFVAVFVEQIGLPVPSGPVLLAAGSGGVSPSLPGTCPRSGGRCFVDKRLSVV